ncbi:MAG: methionyl-tRNA formyltransferase [Nitrospirota bacterium]|nr:methionyl-tRNA formyltransferase [Nitrospirota bacterium]
MRVVFMGTPPIAVPSLLGLIGAGYRVVAVVTQPDRPKGRGGKLAAPPVKESAAALHVPVLQPPRVRDEGFQQHIRELAPDVAVVIAFGQILPQSLLDIPRFGCINVHASLLPRYRGAAPINWAIANGETETGLTTMRMDAGMDTGPTYLTASTPIGAGEDAVSLAGRLGELAVPLLLDTLRQVGQGLQPTPQDVARATLAPILRKEDGGLHWEWPAARLVNHVRAFVPWPGSHTRYADTPWRVTAARAGEPDASAAAPGTLLRVDGDSLLVRAGEGSTVRILALQVPGKRPMPVRDFLNGTRIEPGVVLGAG